MFSIQSSKKYTAAGSGELKYLLQSLQQRQQSSAVPKKIGYISADGTEIIKAEQPTDLRQQQRDQAKAQRKALTQVRLQSGWRSAAVQTYLRLAKAATVRDAKSVAYRAADQVHQLKRALSSECDEATQVKAVLGQMQRAVIRAKLKARQLGEEQGLELREKKAQEQAQKARAMYLEMERKKRIVTRKVREEGYVRESVVSRYLEAERIRQQVEVAAPTVPGGASPVGEPPAQGQAVAVAAVVATPPVTG